MDASKAIIFLVNAAEMSIFFWLLHRRLGFRRLPVGLPWLCALAVTFGLWLIAANGQSPLWVAVLLPVGILLSFVLCESSVRLRIWIPVHFFGLCLLLHLLLPPLFAALVGRTTAEILAEVCSATEAHSGAAVLLLYLTFLVGTRGLGKPHRRPGVVHVIYGLMPLLSLGYLALILDHEMAMGDTGDSLVLTMAAGGIVVINLMVLLLLELFLCRNEELCARELQLRQMEVAKGFLDDLQAVADVIRRFRHDMGNHLQVLRGLMATHREEEARAYLDDIGQLMQDLGQQVDTGHPLVDTLVGTKIARAEREGIDVDYAIELPKELPFAPLELCSLLGNILDNAIEACTMLGPQADRFLFLHIGPVGQDLLVTLRNSAPPPHTPPARRQSDGHCERGLGIPTVRGIVDQYGGSLHIDRLEDEYHLLLRVPLTAPQWR